MSDVSKNEALIAEARERAAIGADVDPIDAARLLNELADELEYAARVPVQGEPNDDREARVKRIILESLVFTNENSEPWAQLLAENILAALDGAPEPEWEYVGMAFEHGGFMRIRNDQLVPEKFDSWRKLMAQYPRVEILKRVKAVPAGPWLPVEGESK